MCTGALQRLESTGQSGDSCVIFWGFAESVVPKKQNVWCSGAERQKMPKDEPFLRPWASFLFCLHFAYIPAISAATRGQREACPVTAAQVQSIRENDFAFSGDTALMQLHWIDLHQPHTQNNNGYRGQKCRSRAEPISSPVSIHDWIRISRLIQQYTSHLVTTSQTATRWHLQSKCDVFRIKGKVY